MERGRSILVGAALAVGLCTSSGAASVTLTGAELLSQPGVTFPSVSPTIVGTSLFFGAPIANGFGKLISISLDRSASGSYSFVLNFTRVAGWQDPSLPLNPAYGYDHDLHIVASDGTNMVGGYYGDNNNGTIGGVTFLEGQSYQAGRLFAPSQTDAGFPEIGQSFDIALEYSLLPGSTTVSARLYNTVSVFTETSRALNPSAPLSLAMISDEDYTQYQLNSVTLVTSTVPTPAAAWVLLSGLGGLGLLARRKAA